MSAPPAPPLANGQTTGPSPVERAAWEEKLLQPLTEGYKPTLPYWSLYTTDAIPQFYLLRDIELMMTHPVVRSSLDYFKGGIAGAEFWGGESPDGNPEGQPIADDPVVVAFVKDQCQRYWDRGVPKIQGGYEYGWIGCEALYAEDGDGLRWDDFAQFSPRDTFLLTADSRPVGVRVKNVHTAVVQEANNIREIAGKEAKSGTIDLWLASDDIPAKGVWYAHCPRYHSWYGQSQLLGAWRPWRRLAWKDGAETVTDGGIYRFAYAGPIVGYPEEDLQGPPGSVATTLDSQGRPRRYARDMARMMAEWFKAGAGVGLPTTKYPSDLGGGDKWTFNIPKSTLNISGLIEYVKYLIDQIRFGVGVPPELFEASETGSGYSGRAIPIEGFMLMQQRLADALLELFVRQILQPLVKWRFGPVRFQVKVKNLIQSKMKMQGKSEKPGMTQQGPGVNLPPGGGGPAPLPGQRDLGTAPAPWLPHTGPQGQQGWQSSGGRVLYQQTPPGGLSLTEPAIVTDRIREIARKVLEASRRAA